ncbi:MAG: STAS domain-containing protein, partial [Lachnospiraceae bacterium]|nr:STAS domain-containing protein [Lachnospiraceae bacterium]
GGSLWLNLDGRIDASGSTSLRFAIMRAFPEHNSIVLNMEKVPAITSAGIRVLQFGKKTADSQKGRLMLINPNPMVRDALRVTGMDKLLDIR